MPGFAKRTSARTLLLGPLDMTLRIESVPLLVAGLPWSTQLSALAGTVTGPVGQLGSTVHEWVAGEPSTLPAASVARTRNSCGPTARPL